MHITHVVVVFDSWSPMNLWSLDAVFEHELTPHNLVATAITNMSPNTLYIYFINMTDSSQNPYHMHG